MKNIPEEYKYSVIEFVKNRCKLVQEVKEFIVLFFKHNGHPCIGCLYKDNCDVYEKHYKDKLPKL